MLKKTCFSRPLFMDFSLFRSPKMDSKSIVFRTFFVNVNFVKIIVFRKKIDVFQVSGLPKPTPKSMPKRNRKKHRKRSSQKSILASILGSKILPKSIQSRHKSKKFALKKNFKKKAHAKHPYSEVLSGSQAFWDPHRPSNYDSND